MVTFQQTNNEYHKKGLCKFGEKKVEGVVIDNMIMRCRIPPNANNPIKISFDNFGWSNDLFVNQFPKINSGRKGKYEIKRIIFAFIFTFVALTFYGFIGCYRANKKEDPSEFVPFTTKRDPNREAYYRGKKSSK